MSLKEFFSRLGKKTKQEVMAQGNAGSTAKEVNERLDEAEKLPRPDPEPDSSMCITCKKISYHPMDKFFMWCAGCNKSYGHVVYHNHERAELGQIHTDFPTYTLEEVVDFHNSMR